MTRFIEIDNFPVPPHAEAGEFSASDGAKLRTAFFPAENPRGTVIVAPGWSEFIEKYFEVVEDLRERRLNVAMMDWRGQGLSDDPDGWDGYFHRLSQDLLEFRDGPVAARFGGPCLLITHSMGGLPALLLMARGDEGFARAVLTAPMTRLFSPTANAVLRAAAVAVSSLGGANKRIYRGEDDSRAFDQNMLTSDPNRHRRFRELQDAEPAAARPAPTYGWVRDAMKMSKAIHQKGFFDHLKTPILIVSAGAERRVDGADHKNIADMSARITHASVDEALHEIMMEADEYRTDFWAKVDKFFAPALKGGT